MAFIVCNVSGDELIFNVANSFEKIFSHFVYFIFQLSTWVLYPDT